MKVSLAVGKGKAQYDKREDLKKRDTGTRREVKVDGASVLLFWYRSSIYAIENRSPAEGAYSESWRFTVGRAQAGAAAATSQPRLVIEAFDVRANIIQVKGRTDPGATVTINGQRADVRRAGSFNEFVTLEIKPGPQAVVLRAAGVSGGANEVRRSVVVGF